MTTNLITFDGALRQTIGQVSGNGNHFVFRRWKIDGVT
jgi:hypothetical protein